MQDRVVCLFVLGLVFFCLFCFLGFLGFDFGFGFWGLFVCLFVCFGWPLL